MKRFLSALAVSSLLSVSGALAADEVMPVGDGAYGWSGLYGGVLLGYGYGNTTATGDPGFDGSAPGDRANLNPDGFVGGAVAGYNWQRGSMVYGVEGEIGYLGAGDDVWHPNGDDYFASTEYGVYGSLAARIGHAMDRTLIAARAGVVVAQINYGFGDIDGGPSGNVDASASVFSDTGRFGGLIGASVEHAFTDRWIGRIDYSYMRFIDIGDTDFDNDNYNISNDMHLFRIGLVRKF